MPVLLSDCKKGDMILFSKRNEPRGTSPAARRIGVIRSINKTRQTLLVSCRAVIDGELRECRWYVHPDEVIGFAV